MGHRKFSFWPQTFFECAVMWLPDPVWSSCSPNSDSNQDRRDRKWMDGAFGIESQHRFLLCKYGLDFSALYFKHIIRRMWSFSKSISYFKSKSAAIDFCFFHQMTFSQQSGSEQAKWRHNFLNIFWNPKSVLGHFLNIHFGPAVKWLKPALELS